MTREEFYNIQSAVERIRERAIARHYFSHSDYDSGIANGCLEVLDYLAGIEDSLPSEPQEHNEAPKKDWYDKYREDVDAVRGSSRYSEKGLDKAAEEYAPDLPSYISGSISIAPESRQDLRDAFKAGAKWMAEQGETIETSIQSLDIVGKAKILLTLNGEYNFGDKVIIQIRKKEQ